MRVVLLKAQLSKQGGLEKYANRIASSFVQRGAHVTFVTTNIPENKDPRIDYCVFPVCRWPGFLRIEQFDRSVCSFLQNTSADLVFGMDRNRTQTHIRAGNGIHAAYLKSRLASEGILKYAISHINPLHLKILEIEKTALEHPNLKKVFVNSHMVKNDLLQHYSTDPSKIEVLHNGVEWKEHEFAFETTQENRKTIYTNFGFNPECLHLLFIGNGYQRKGLLPLLKALAIWKFRHFHLSIVGKDKHIDAYRAHAAKLGLSANVSFFGVQTNAIPFYQMADVLVIPSFYDPFANVTVEALSLGLFVISSKTNGGYEILTEHNGVCIENLMHMDAMIAALDRALHFRKTPESAAQIRASVAHLDFSIQIPKLINHCV